jgi:hypothetical protein
MYSSHYCNSRTQPLHHAAVPPHTIIILLPGPTAPLCTWRLATSVMLDIITQREEAEEARILDEARKLSELSRKEDAKQRRGELERQLQTLIERSSVEEWLLDKQRFVQSWILRGDAKAVLQRLVSPYKTPMKCKVIALLQLEKKARKWYGDMPRSYFARQLTQRLIPMTTAETMLAQVQREIDTLETVMYDLSEQMGGVPKVFRDAHDAAVAENWSGSDENGNDDAVLLVPGPRPTTEPTLKLFQSARDCPSKSLYVRWYDRIQQTTYNTY